MATENEMTFLELDPITAEEVKTQDQRGNSTRIYVMRGDSLDRERNMTFKELALFLQTLFNDVYISTNGKIVNITPEMLEFTNSQGEVANYSKSGVYINVEGLSFILNNEGLHLENGEKEHEFDVFESGLSFRYGTTKLVKIEDGEIFNINGTTKTRISDSEIEVNETSNGEELKTLITKNGVSVTDGDSFVQVLKDSIKISKDGKTVILTKDANGFKANGNLTIEGQSITNGTANFNGSAKFAKGATFEDVADLKSGFIFGSGASIQMLNNMDLTLIFKGMPNGSVVRVYGLNWYNSDHHYNNCKIYIANADNSVETGKRLYINTNDSRSMLFQKIDDNTYKPFIEGVTITPEEPV